MIGRHDLTMAMKAEGLLAMDLVRAVVVDLATAAAGRATAAVDLVAVPAGGLIRLSSHGCDN